MMKRNAEQVRTGDRITNPWAYRGFWLDVAWTIRERFVSPEGVIGETVWFAGQDNFGAWRDRCAGMPVGRTVYVLRDSMDCPMPYGELEMLAEFADLPTDDAEDYLL